MKKRRKSRSRTGRPKGSYPVPGGGYATPGSVHVTKTGRRIRVTGIRREEIDIPLLAHALFELALYEIDRQRDDKR
jgi:hypothetical protein